jgi:HAMP domain-containing protein
VWNGFARLAGASLVLAFAVALGSEAAAQGPRRVAGPEQRLAHLTQRLELSEEQQKRIMPILQDEAGELRAAFQKARESGDRTGLRDAVRAIHARSDEKIEAQLDEKQKTAFHALRKEQRERMEKRRPLRQGPPQ